MKKNGFTLVEVLVVMTIIAILASIILPVISRAKGAAYKTSCLSNIRQLAQAALQYSGDNDGKLPSNVVYNNSWLAQISNYKAGSIAKCPLFVEGNIHVPPTPLGMKANPIPQGYALNGCLKDGTNISEPTTTVFFAETAELTYYDDQNELHDEYPVILTAPDLYAYAGERAPTFFGGSGALRHQGSANYAMFDESARSLKPEQFRLPDIRRGCNLKGEVQHWVGNESDPHFAIEAK